jgi:transglutaminase-like putative cysteine protease
MVAISSLTAVLSYAIALCGIVPLFPFLTVAPRVALAAGMLAGIRQDRRGTWPVKNWQFNLAVVPVFLYYALQFSRANPAQPVVSALAIMLAVRLCGEKSVRHYLQIDALSLFCLASSSLFNLSPVFLFYLALMLLLVAVSLVLLTFHSLDSRLILPRAHLRKVLAVGLMMPLASLPLLVIFFPILPRTQIPLWNFLAAPATRPSGFSDKVEPGASAIVGESRTIAFRVEMPRQPQQQLYWRGTVFNRMDGNRWVRDTAVPPEQLQYKGPRIAQTVYPEPGPSRALFSLDAPAAIALPRARGASDGVFEYPGPITRRLSYGAESVTSGILPTVTGIDRAFYLRLPSRIPERVRQLAADVKRHGTGDARRLELLEQYFRNGNYRYSMRDLPTGEDALEQFLFEKKQGHCEFFASAFALLLRAAGVPARLVGGYLGGDYNELGGYYLISDDMAHVWVEAFIDGRGWVRVDPSSFARNAGEVWGGEKQRNPAMKLRLFLDSLDHTWNRAIVTYDFEQQAEIARNAGKRLQKLEAGKTAKAALPYLLLPVALALALAVIVRRKGLFTSRNERLQRRFYRLIERDCGIRSDPGRLGLFEAAGLTGNDRAREFAAIYAGALYRDRKLTVHEFARLRRILRDGFVTKM